MFFRLCLLFPFILPAQTTLRGVPPHRKHLYGGETFRCTSQQLPISFVNDDYCDCIDGSDEPGTSACGNGRFSCPNRGWKREEILSSRVNDGICDCCDGSDEYASDAGCQQTCFEFKRDASKDLYEQLEDIKNGLEEKTNMIAKADGVRRQKLEEIERLKKEIEEQSKIVEEKQKLKEEKEAKEQIEKDRRKDEHERRKKEKDDKEKCGEEGEACDDVGADDAGAGDTGVDTEVPPDGNEGENVDSSTGEIQQTSSDEQVHGDANGETVEEDDGDTSAEAEGEDGETKDKSFPYPEEYAFHEDDESGDSNDASDGEMYEECEGSECIASEGFEESDDYWSEEEEYFDSEEEFLDEEDYEKWYNYKEEEATTARNEYQDENRKKTDLEKSLEKAEKFMETDFGSELEYTALYGECFNKKIAKYTYEFCGFDKAVQKEGGSTTDLGKFEGWKSDTEKRVMQFTKGQRCWQGPERSLDVQFLCGPANKVISVNEPSKCVYEMVFKTPSACSQENYEDVQRKINEVTNAEKDEL